MSLTVRGLTVYRGGRLVLDRVDLEVPAGSVAAVLGPNGAGKTALLDTIAGALEHERGSIRLDGRELRGRAHQRARSGLRLVGESRGVIPELRVRQNLELAQLGAGVRSLAPDLLDLFPRLVDRLDVPAGQLSGGEQQMLALAMGLAGEPRVLLLDEPSFGLAPRVVDDLFRTLAELRARGLTILLAEQHVSRALDLADQVVVLRAGRVVHRGPAGGSSEELERIVEGYLGRVGGTQAEPSRSEVTDLVRVTLPVPLKRHLQLVARRRQIEPGELVSETLEAWLRMVEE